MNTKRILGLGFLVALSACKGQCSCGTDDDDDGTGVGGAGGNPSVTVTVSGSGSTTGNGGAGGGTGGAGTGGDPTTVGTGGAGGSGETIVDPTIRFLNVASNAEDVNFCILDDDGVLSDPIVSGGLASPNVTAYDVEFASPGNYSIVLAAADDEACDAEASPVFGPFALDNGGVYTLALVGNALDDANPIELVRFEDTLEFPAAGNTKLRFIHAAAGAPPVDVGEYVDDQFVPYFTGAAYGDDAGYTNEVPAFDAATLVARAAGTETDLLEVPNVDGEDGSIVNAIAVGNVLDGEIDVDVFIFSDSPTN